VLEGANAKFFMSLGSGDLAHHCIKQHIHHVTLVRVSTICNYAFVLKWIVRSFLSTCHPLYVFG